ncbi:MAG: DUF2784 domain-containing protein [Proteobacteria bacterium]|nr:DUF2784 domain-containing protein [Pseudomonadota bacterium]
MSYLLLSWLVVAAHAAFILFVTLGGAVVSVRPRLALAHVPAALWGAYVEFSGRVCPLTPLENRLRALAGAAGYPEGFLEHYVLSLIYPATLTVETQYVLGAFVLVVNVLWYGRAWRAIRSRPRRAG